MAGVLVKMKVTRETYDYFVAEITKAGQADRISADGQAVSLDEIALVPNDLPEAPPVSPEEALKAALAPLVAIADAYDHNGLDDEARKFWGASVPNDRKPEDIELYAGRGGKRLLTLADCLKARTLVRGLR
jgi:hypothetical protein